MSDDGHTASLFPKSGDAEDLSKPCLQTQSPKGVAKRVTLGTRVIIEAEKVITVITGAGKSECIQWLKDRDMTKPFISVLSQRQDSVIYIDTDLYSLLEA